MLFIYKTKCSSVGNSFYSFIKYNFGNLGGVGLKFVK